MGKYQDRSRLIALGGRRSEARDSFFDTLEKAGHIYVARIVDRTKRCSCIAIRDDRHNEPDPDCKICDQLGFLYNDKEILGYKAYEVGTEIIAEPKRISADKMLFYTTFDAFTDRRQAEFSRIIELKMDTEGVILPGNLIEEKYNVKDAVPFRDHGQLIYWKLAITTKEV